MLDHVLSAGGATAPKGNMVIVALTTGQRSRVLRDLSIGRTDLHEINMYHCRLLTEVCPPTSSYVEALSPSVTVFGDGALKGGMKVK